MTVEKRQKVQVTLWYRDHAGKREYNHLEMGWSDSLVPAAVSEEQAKIWKGGVWHKVQTYAAISGGGQSMIVEKRA